MTCQLIAKDAFFILKGTTSKEMQLQFVLTSITKQHTQINIPTSEYNQVGYIRSGSRRTETAIHKGRAACPKHMRQGVVRKMEATGKKRLVKLNAKVRF